jgi:2-polyprenyl-3-methyl-5-hydroxy-6-metoxy-1,4-benzoquinol methylase
MTETPMGTHTPAPSVPENCRSCAARLSVVAVDLGMAPMAAVFPRRDGSERMQPFYPLRAFVCERCLLLQVEQVASEEETFSADYAWFSSFSEAWLKHARAFAQEMSQALDLGTESMVVEVGSNDGHLLGCFAERGIRVQGVDPAETVGRAAIERGIPTAIEFFGRDCAARLAADRKADLIIANNVIAHVPDLNDFVGGLKLLLREGGTITVETLYLLRLLETRGWDTIYHEHFSYFTVHSARRLFSAQGLRLFDVEELPTHGGSLRLYACHDEDREHSPSRRLEDMLQLEESRGLKEVETYRAFGEDVRADKRQILSQLISVKDDGKRIAGYGASVKANTLLNYCGIGSDFIDYCCELHPTKQGRVLPGSDIAICGPDVLKEDRPDFVLIFPWNHREEIMEQLSFVRAWGGRFLVRAPELRVFE